MQLNKAIETIKIRHLLGWNPLRTARSGLSHWRIYFHTMA